MFEISALAFVICASSTRPMTFGATIAARIPIMITTTMISIRVNPRWRLLLRRCL